MALNDAFFSPAVREAYSIAQIATMQEFGYSVDEIEENALKKLPGRAPRSVNAQAGHPTSNGGLVNNVNMAASAQPALTNNVIYGSGNMLYNGYPLSYGQPPHNPFSLAPWGQFSCYPPPSPPPPLPPPPPSASNWQQPVAVGQHDYAGLVGINPQFSVLQMNQPGFMNGFGQNLQSVPQADNMSMSASNGSVIEEAFSVPLPKLKPNSDWDNVELSDNSLEIDPPVIPADFTPNLSEFDVQEFEEFLQTFGYPDDMK